MIALLQRVRHAQVEVNGRLVGAIAQGLLVFIGVLRDDEETDAERLLDRVLNYRVFADAEGKMNLSLIGVQGGLLLVPQFTLAADTRTGLRPSFTPAASPERGQKLFDHLVHRAQSRLPAVACGVFGADMQVSLTNEGPATFWLQVPPGGNGQSTIA